MSSVPGRLLRRGGATGTGKPGASAERPASVARSGSTAASLAASPVAAGSVPAGYKRSGGAAQGISLAVPVSWTVDDLSKEDPETVAREANPGRSSAATFLQQPGSLQKFHAILAYDTKAAALDIPRGFVPNFDAACSTSTTADTGAAGIPLIKADKAYELKNIAATHITVKNLKIGNVPGLEFSYQYRPAGDYETLYGTDLAVLPSRIKLAR